MRSTLAAAAFVACGSPTVAVLEGLGPAVTLPPPELAPQPPGCASVEDPIDVVGFEAEYLAEYPFQHPLRRRAAGCRRAYFYPGFHT